MEAASTILRFVTAACSRRLRKNRDRVAQAEKSVLKTTQLPCPMCHAPGSSLLTTRGYRGKEYSLALCGLCGQHFCVPPPSASEIAAFYEGDYHGSLRTPGASESKFGPKFRRYRDWVLEFLKGGRSLDIGTSTGLFPHLLKQAGFQAEGLEFNPASAAWGEANYGIRIRTCSLEETGEPPASFDLISMTDVLEHTESPVHYLEMVRRYLKPGGYLLVTFPDINSPESRYLRFFARVFGRDWIWSTCHIPLHVWEFTPKTARAMFHKAQFDVVDFRRSHETEADTPEIPALALIHLPLKILANPAVGRLAGTQMEFLVRRSD